MKIKHRSGDDERVILTAMIMDVSVCGRIAARWPKPDQPKLFASKWTHLIGSWCVKHFNKYTKAPGRAIGTIYKAWAESKQQDKELVEPIERLLHSLNDEYERQDEAPSSEYILDLASQYFNRLAARNVAELALADLDSGDPAAAIKRLESFQTVRISESDGGDAMSDASVKTPYTEKNESLIDLPGDAGRFFGNAFHRDSFISITAKEKSGKTQWLLHLAWWAMLQRRRVAFFECGDMSWAQLMRRFNTRAANRPDKARTIWYPTSIGWSDTENRVVVEQEKRKFADDMNWQAARRACDDIMTRRMKTTQSFFKLFVYPAGTASVATIRGALDTLNQNEWVADVVVIDYADLLAPSSGYNEYRHQTNDIWKGLRALSQSQHCCLITATQADAKSYDADHLTMKNFSDDKRKWSHVTGGIGINATDVDKKKHMQRINWIVRREEEFNPKRFLYTAPCLALANPCVRSFYR